MDRKQLIIGAGVMAAAGAASAYTGTYNISDMTPISRRNSLRGHSRRPDGYGAGGCEAEHLERRRPGHARSSDLVDGRSRGCTGGRSIDALCKSEANKAQSVKTTRYPLTGVPIFLLLLSWTGYALQDSFTPQDAGSFLVRTFGGLSLGVIDGADTYVLLLLAGFVFFLFLLAAAGITVAAIKAFKRT
jgi:hypothetical protein